MSIMSYGQLKQIAKSWADGEASIYQKWGWEPTAKERKLINKIVEELKKTNDK
jgi:hypothetical protein